MGCVSSLSSRWGRRMNILMSFLYSPPTTACYYAKAFRALGHDVRTWGPTRDLSRYREDQRYRLTGPHMRLPYEDGWQPDLLVYIEAGDGWWPGPPTPSDIPSVAYFIDSHSRLQEHLARAPYFDHVFYAHKQFADAFGPGAQWLPVACDPGWRQTSRSTTSHLLAMSILTSRSTSRDARRCECWRGGINVSL